METITLTKQNFGKEVASLYERIYESGDIQITVTPVPKTHNPKKSPLLEAMEDPENTSYGPFSTMHDAISFLESPL